MADSGGALAWLEGLIRTIIICEWWVCVVWILSTDNLCVRSSKIEAIASEICEVQQNIMANASEVNIRRQSNRQLRQYEV